MLEMRKLKDSGIEWIGEIPEGWEIIPVKYLAKYNYDTLAESCSPDFEFSYIDIGSVTYTDGITNYQNFKFKDAPSRARRIVHSGDILVSTVRTYLRAVACVNEHRLPQIASTGFLVLQADISKIHPHFLMYSVLSDNFICKVEANSVGISYPAINASQIVHFKLPIPQLSEQFLLVTYLDRQCSEIDALLSKTLSSIEEYKKLKQAVITQAVTKTIYDDFGNPSKFRKLRSLCDVLSKGTTPKDIETQNDEFYCIRYLKSENIVSNQLNLNPTFFITAETNNSLERSKLNSGDILFVIAGASIGKVAITTADFLPANTNQAVAFIRLSSSYQYATKYIWYFLQSDVVKQLIALSAVQSAQPNLSLEDLGAMRLPLPDQMGCLKITDYLDAKCAEIDKLIAKKEQLVKELESYKKSLIYEVVTGKREV